MGKINTVQELHDAIKRSQSEGKSLPEDERSIVVDRGEVLLAKDALDRNPRALTVVPQDIFA